MTTKIAKPWMPENCAIRQHTGDGVSVGRCFHYLKDGVCPIHGDVRAAQKAYVETGTTTNDFDLEKPR